MRDVFVVGMLATPGIIQLIWAIRNHQLFLRHKKMWEAAKDDWDAAQKLGDKTAMEAAYHRERKIYKAEKAIHADLFLPPWKWIKRWNYNYLDGDHNATL